MSEQHIPVWPSDENNFSYWKRNPKFLDKSLDHLDFFSYNAYNYVHVLGGSHTNHLWHQRSSSMLILLT